MQTAGSISRDHLKSNRIALFVSRDLQPAVLNRAVHKQSLSNTVLITVWRLELRHVIVQYRLGGLVVRVSAFRAEGPGFESQCHLV